MSDWLLVAIGAIGAVIVPEIAVGASVGSLFFMLAYGSETGLRKAALVLVGWFSGYFTATPFIETGWAGLIAVLGSAFAVILTLQLFIAIETDGEAPKFLDWGIKAIKDLFVKR